MYTADVNNGNVVLSQGVGVTNNLTVSGGFNYTPPGVIMQWATVTAPVGYLICDGSAVSRTGFAALFAIIGTTHGAGNNSKTFNIPSIVGRAAVGRNSGDSSFASLGYRGGSTLAQLTANKLPSHTHSITDNHAMNDPGRMTIPLRLTTGLEEDNKATTINP